METAVVMLREERTGKRSSLSHVCCVFEGRPSHCGLKELFCTQYVFKNVPILVLDCMN